MNYKRPKKEARLHREQQQICVQDKIHNELEKQRQQQLQQLKHVKEGNQQRPKQTHELNAKENFEFQQRCDKLLQSICDAISSHLELSADLQSEDY